MSKNNLTQIELKQLLSYDPETGVFLRLTHHPRFPIGSIAGSKKKRGHITIRIGYDMYKAHRLAWLYVYGEWPKDQIDHIDCDPGNNRIRNLREADNSQNHANCKRQPNNTSGHKGVRLDKRRGKWHVSLKHKGKERFLGYYDKFDVACSAYAQAAHDTFGQYARIE